MFLCRRCTGHNHEPRILPLLIKRGQNPGFTNTTLCFWYIYRCFFPSVSYTIAPNYNEMQQQWGTELDAEITEDMWLHAWETQSSWRDFCWKNLNSPFFFISPNQKSKQTGSGLLLKGMWRKNSWSCSWFFGLVPVFSLFWKEPVPHSLPCISDISRTLQIIKAITKYWIQSLCYVVISIVEQIFCFCCSIYSSLAILLIWIMLRLKTC